MLLLSRSWMILMAVCLVVSCTGCPSKTETKPKKIERQPVAMPIEEKEIVSEKPAAQPVEKKEAEPVVEKQKSRQVAALPTIPKVFLSNEHRAACLVDVGDRMPDAKLPDPTGKIHALESLYGQKYTVVCFWTLETPRSQLVSDAVLEDLTMDVAKPFGSKGVGVVGINVGDPAGAVEQKIAQTGASFPCLIDSRGGYFARIASDKRMPRTFLLDANGRILWFDVEYSRPSRRELLHCIQVALGEL